MSCTKLLFEFLAVDFLRSPLVSIASSKKNIIKMKFIINASDFAYFEQVFVAYVSTHLPTYLLLMYQLIRFFVHFHQVAIIVKKHNSGLLRQINYFIVLKRSPQISQDKILLLVHSILTYCAKRFQCRASVSKPRYELTFRVSFYLLNS